MEQHGAHLPVPYFVNHIPVNMSFEVLTMVIVKIMFSYVVLCNFVN